ncbi:hypothetical protein GKE82_04735 [Conexibacter sp. W3-3-2]|uniref:alpha-N-acetylglucosaminidase n=1 Tax=Conexibacter sp. W3-3-2 TaxID=2675227 RepID=UPI0012B8C0C1|nr:alpha-N-acetylglucosaminidase TIM-barrel domain-containing protein [Conexibacter sp. W3-3-2]MTD43627.1 hypothetical protein [Conexibacter sp. W3-3-2]
MRGSRGRVALLVVALTVGTADVARAATPERACTATRAAGDGPGTAAVRAAVRRMVPRLAPCLTLRLTPARADGLDALSVRASRGRVLLRGSSRVALVRAVRVYVEDVLRGELSREARRVPSRALLPRRPLRRTSPYRVRYTNNFTVAGYTTPYWSWAEWERELDHLAYSGINAALVMVGQELAYYRTLREFGYDDREARDWLVLPAHQPWQWLGNHMEFGPAPSMSLMERRAELGRRIVRRMHELGIDPVIPGFAGTVPWDYVVRNPGTVAIPQIYLAGPSAPMLDPSTPGYAAFASRLYVHQNELFGRIDSRTVNVFHEESTPIALGGAAAVARTIERTLRDASPDYRWYLEGWKTVPGLVFPEQRGDLFETPPQAVLDVADRSRLMVVDLTGEAWKHRDGYGGAPWLRGVLTNFGGRRPLYGPLTQYAEQIPRTAADPARGAFSGVAITPEGFDTNPVVWSFLADLAWREGPVDAGAWMRAHVRNRYGRDDPDAQAAWATILRTAYGRDNGQSGAYGGADSLLNARPSLTAVRSGSAAPNVLQYDPAELEGAWRRLLAAAPRLARTATYRYDLVDVTRQVLANRARVLLPRLNAAYAARDRAAFDRLSAAYLELLDLQERLLATSDGFLLGPWIAAARSWAESDAEAADLEFDARSILTIWAQRAGSVFDNVRIDDYANRDWAGMTGGYYRPRWAAYLQALSAELGKPLPADQATVTSRFDWWAIGERFSRDRTAFPTRPQGDPVAAARAVERALRTG